MLGNRTRQSFQDAWIATQPSYIYPVPKRQDVCRQDPTILPRYGPSKTKPLPSYVGSSSTTDRYLWYSKPVTSKCSNFVLFLVISSDRCNFSKGTSQSIGQYYQMIRPRTREVQISSDSGGIDKKINSADILLQYILMPLRWGLRPNSSALPDFKF